MNNKLRKALLRAHRNQQGITGLETAIILIAFVTVASVLAYAVLSAGIFSAERGKETVYEGLKYAQATMETKGSILALDNSTEPDQLVDEIEFNVALVLKGEKVDMTAGLTAVTVVNFISKDGAQKAEWRKELLSTERGSGNILEGDEVMKVIVTVPSTTSIGVYDSFTIEVLPPTGSALTIQRTMGGSVEAVNNLN
jgi:archaeal flagellin FlaB